MQVINRRESIRQPTKNKHERALFWANLANPIIDESLLDVAGGDQLVKQYIEPTVRYSRIGLYENRGQQTKHAISTNLENRCAAEEFHIQDMWRILKRNNKDRS